MKRHRRKLAVVAAGAVFSAAIVVEGREAEHIEQRQHEEPDQLTQTISVSTATVAALPALNFDVNWLMPSESLWGQKFKIKF